MNRLRLERGAGSGDPIRVWPDGGTAPTEFVWRGRRYRVRTLEVDGSEGRRPRGGRRRYRVLTSDGLSCVLAQEGLGGAWRIDRLISSGGGR